jgi:hypothetical protein
MKKVLLAVILIIGFDAGLNAQFKVGIRGGGNLSNQRIGVSEGTIYPGNSYRGFHAGLMGEANLGGNFYLQPQLLFSRKGASHLSSSGNSAIQVKMNYLEVPVNLVYKIDLSFGKLFGGAGAAFSYGIGGTLKQDGVSQNLYGEGSWKREDISLVFTGGIEFDNGLFASINSQKGMRDIHKAEGTSIKNRSLSLSVGYLLDLQKFKKH